MDGEDRPQPTLPTCVNGHRMLVGTTTCPVCSAPVKRSTVSQDRRADDPGRAVRDKVDAERRARGEVDTDRQPGRVVAVIAVVLLLLGGGIAAMVLTAGDGSEPEPSFTDPTTPAVQTCATLGVTRVPLDSVVSNAPTPACFEVAEEIVLLLGAEPEDKNENLQLRLTKPDGGFIGAADDTFGNVPELSVSLVPGVYIATVTAAGGGEPGAFTLYSTVYDPNFQPTPEPSATDDQGGLPGSEDCGVGDLPLLTDNGSVEAAAGDTLVCFELTEDAWTKIGVISLASPTAPGGVPDLVLVLHSFDDSGRPRFVRSFDDAFGTDPEASTRLAAGRYLIQIEEWRGEDPGPTEVYVDTARTYFRVGDVAEGWETVTPEDCAVEGVREIVVGGTLGFEDPEITYTCINLSRTTLLEFDVLSLTPQDLALEVIGFDADGTPLRYGWADDFAFVTDFSDKDPRLQTVLPAGLYYVHVYELFGEPVGSFTIEAKQVN